MRAALAAQFAGAALVALGVGLMFPAVGIVVAGGFLLAFGIVMGRDA